MAVYKDNNSNTWRAVYRYTDWNGERKQTQKRGFQTKREAQAWEREQLCKTSSEMDMTFSSFAERYTEDLKPRLKENTWATKEHILQTKLLPFFGKLKMSSITPQQVITWQNDLMKRKNHKGNHSETNLVQHYNVWYTLGKSDNCTCGSLLLDTLKQFANML